MTLTTGQKLWLVPARGHAQPREVDVEKIGRKWATLSGSEGRIDLETLRVDGGGLSSPGRCYLDEAAWNADQRTELVWRALVDKLWRFNRDPEVSETDIREAARLLRIDIPLQEAAE